MIRLVFSLLLGVMMVEAGADGAVPVATYIEVAPRATGAAVTALEAEAGASRRDDGCEAARVLQEIARRNRFVLLEVWKDQDAFAAHGKTPHTEEFRRRLGAILTAPPDERVHVAFWDGPATRRPAAAALWVVTHVDVPPPQKDEAQALLRELGAASAAEAGNLRFSVAQQTSRPNHFTVTEIWKDRAAFDAHQAGAAARQFRSRLGPMLGALYDQRLYRSLD